MSICTILADTIDTAILPCTDDTKGVECILDLVLNILTYGIVIVAVLGIVIAGVQYLTARDNEAQMTKAKTRIFQIVIGLVAYAVMWAVLKFLLPGFNPSATTP